MCAVKSTGQVTLNYFTQDEQVGRNRVESNESHDSEEMLKRKEKLAPAGSQTQDNLRPNVGFQQPKPTNQAGTVRSFSPNRLVPNDGMVQLTFAGVPLTAAT